MTKTWVGWEEDVLLDDKGNRLVCYYLRCAPPRDGDGEAKRDPAVVGKLWGEGNMAYTAHPQFLRSIEEAVALSPGPSRAATLGDEAVELRWKTRREVMDWLTSLVADSPYGASKTAVTSDGCSIGDLDGGSAASKDAGPSTFAGNNSEGFAWLGPLPHLDTWRKRYRSFCRDGMRISVHDFIYIESVAGTESHVAYVEDLYEDGSENRMVLARWLEKPGDDHGVAMPPDVHDREVFFSYGLQDVGVSCVEGLAAVLNYQHFEWFQSRAEEHCKWKPYLCYRKIVGTTVTPFDIAQLHGYAKQEILQALYRAPSSSMAVHFREPNHEDKTDGGQKRKHDESPAAPGNVTGNQAIETQTALTVIDTMQKLPQCHAANDQTVAIYAPQNVAINDQTMQQLPPCNATNDQNIQKLPPQNFISEKTSKNNAPVNASKTQTVENKASSTAAHAQALTNIHPSGGSASGSGLLGNSVVKPNEDELFNLGCRVEALSQDSGIRGCWFRGVIVKKKHKGELVKLKYQDIRDAEGKGHLKEWLKLKRTANPDRLGIRLTGRPIIRPSPSNLPKIPSPVTAGAVVDVRKPDGWWEGIVVEPTTVGRVRVYFPGERRVEEFVEKDLRRSFEWVGHKWLGLMSRKDVAARLPPTDVVANQVMPKPDMQKRASLLSSMGAATNANQAAAKAILRQMKGEPVNSVPVEEERKTNEQAAVSTTPPTIDLTDD